MNQLDQTVQTDQLDQLNQLNQLDQLNKSVLSEQEIRKYANNFWQKIKNTWDTMYDYIISNSTKNEDLDRVLQLLHCYAGPLSSLVDFEVTFGEINRVVFEKSKNVVEIYLSPKLLKENIAVVDILYETRPVLSNFHVNKYRAYNPKDCLISNIEYPDATFDYTDFGCQYFSGVSDNKKPLINIVIYVKDAAARKLLVKKEMTFITADQKEQKLMKWLPSNMNVIDVLLTNVIGEYNLINRTGYIEFLPEGDPLIMAGSVFTELNDLKPAYAMLDKMTGVNTCVVCCRKSYQSDLYVCAKCKKSKYCCRSCQAIDFPKHKLKCGALDP